MSRLSRVSTLLLVSASLAIGAHAASFTYHDYDGIVSELEALAAAHPERTELFTAQERYGLPPVLDGGKELFHYILRITNESTGFDKAELLLVGGQHGDEIVGPEVCLQTGRFLLEEYGVDPWITELVDRREIYIMALANPHGFENDKRWSPGTESNNEDMNRDHPYDRDCGFLCDDEVPLSTVGARALHELAKSHLFRVVLDYHGGTEVIIHPWGTPIHTSNSKSPDHLAMGSLGNRMSSYGGSFRGLYPVGTSNDLLGAVIGPLDDSSYATSWDVGNAAPAWPTEGWRAVSYTVEISNNKGPAQSLLGGDAEILVTNGAEDGYIPKNIRIALAAIDSIEPYLIWTNRDEIPASVPAGVPVHVEWEVRGCFDVDDTHVRFGSDSDPRVNFDGQTVSQSEGTPFTCFDSPTQFEADVVFTDLGTQYLAPVAQTDIDLLDPAGGTPPLSPQSWFVRGRTEEGLLFTNDDDPSEINTVQGQIYRGADALAIEVTAGGGYLLTGPTPGNAGEPNTWSVSGATPGATTFFVRSGSNGATDIPGCGGVQVDLANPVVLGSAVADGSGVASITISVPGGASGLTGLFQAAELSSCTPSQLVTYTFP